ncbi:MAG: MFS transporter [Polyangiaceae bacterium]|nr:MFS transporter [Polyangiaceae bacterium]
MTQVAWWREPTRGQWIAFFAAWFGWVMDAFDFTIFLLVMPQIAKEFGVSMTATAGSITLTLLLRLLGGMAAGSLADRFGRKLPLMISVIWFALCDGAVAFAPSFGWILALRALFGFGMGAEWTSGATLAMENWPARSRGIASGVLQGSWAIGYLLAAVVAAWIVPLWGWRTLFLVAALPALFVLPIRIWVPESPDWKKEAEGRAASPLLPELMSLDMMKKVLWASLVMALGFGGYYALTGLYPTLLQTELGLGQGDVRTYVSLFNVGMMAGAIGCGFVAARVGVTAAIVVPSLLNLPFLFLYVGAVAGLLGVGAVAGGALGAGISGVTPLLLTSLFPARIRARMVGLVYHVGAFAAAFVPTAVAALKDYAGFTLMTAIACVAAGCEILLAAAMLIRPAAAEDTARGEAAEPMHT